MNVQDVREKLARVLDRVQALDNVWCDGGTDRSGSVPHVLQVALDMVDGLIERAPFQVGQRVALARTPEITKEKAGGWLHCKHFLVQGAAGTVRCVEFGRGHFSFAVTFDDESWIDSEGTLHPADPARPGHFYFDERDLQRLGI